PIPRPGRAIIYVCACAPQNNDETIIETTLKYIKNPRVLLVWLRRQLSCKMRAILNPNFPGIFNT
ncbi:MAG: hypothetical protein ACK5WZ_02355, partial [Pseudobdellovibrionaceae bacterium]